MKKLKQRMNKAIAVLTALILAIGLFATVSFAEGEISYRLGSVYGADLASGQAGMLQISLVANDPTKTASTITLTPNYTTSGITVTETYGFGAGANPTFTYWVMSPVETPTDVYELSFLATYYDEQNAYVGSETFSVPVSIKNSINENGLEFTSYTSDILDIIPGDEISIEFTLHNTTGAYLEGVKVSLPGLSESKFVHSDGFKYEVVDIPNGGSSTVIFDLIACDGISSVRETISALAEYSIGGKSFTAECDVVVACEPRDEAYESGIFDLTMTDYKVSSSSIKPGKVFTLTIEVENSSKKDIEKARISIDSLNGIKFAVNKGLTYHDFSIDAGETKEIKFELIGCEGISSAREVLPIEISYGSVSSTAYCTLSCKPEENASAEEVFAPNIIIKEYDFGGEFVVAGTKFPLTLHFENVSPDATIENLKITIDGAASIDGGIAFSAANSAKSFFFEKLDPKAADSVTIEMLAKVDAKPNSYPIDVTFTYEYTVGGKRYQAPMVSETINIPLQQEDRLVVNEPYYPNYVVMVGEYCYVSTSLVNKGKSAVYNVTASIRGEGIDMQESSYYIGNIDSGREEYYDAEFTPNMAGDLNLEIVITYEDANGNEKEQVFPFTISVQEMYNYYEEEVWEDPMMGGDMMMGEPIDEGSKLPGWFWYAVGAGGLVIVIVVIVIISKKRKKARLGAFDEDEDI